MWNHLYESFLNHFFAPENTQNVGWHPPAPRLPHAARLLALLPPAFVSSYSPPDVLPSPRVPVDRPQRHTHTRARAYLRGSATPFALPPPPWRRRHLAEACLETHPWRDETKQTRRQREGGYTPISATRRDQKTVLGDSKLRQNLGCSV